jgi:hypothetical protein
MSSGLTFLTPTYEKDLQRFTLLRESMERCEIDIPHVAVVDHEDLHLFKAIPFRHKLTLISSRDALPAHFEERRVARGYSRKHPYHWIKPRPLVGWAAQQIMKLCSPAYVETQAIVCIDSDVFFVDHVAADEFYAPDGKLCLYENDREYTVETIQWMAYSMKALNVPLGQEPFLYVHNPVVFHREVVLGLQQRLEQLHSRNWIDAFLENNLTEYTTYGVYARYVDKLAHVTPMKPPFTLNYWNQEQLEGYAATMIQSIDEKRARFVCINSFIGCGVEEYRSLVEQVWQMRRPR